LFPKEIDVLVDKLEELKEKFTKKQIKSNEYANLLADLVFKFQHEDKLDEILLIIDQYIELLENKSESSIIKNHYGQTVLNSLPLFFTKLTPTEILSIINTLRSLAYELKDELLSEYLAMTLVNLIYDFSLMQRTSSIREFALELIDLSRKYQNKERIETACVKGLMNATMYFLQNNNKQVATDCYKAMMKIIKKYPGKDMVDTMRLQQLKEILE
jgi:hypothetical protein